MDTSNRPGLVTRAVAMGFDLLVLATFQLAFGSFTFWIYEVACLSLDVEPNFHMISFLNTVSSLIVLLSYFSLATAIYGQTVGKYLMGLKILKNNQPLNLRDSLYRTLAYFLSSSTYLIGFILPWFRADGRTLHDLLCDTDVVLVPEQNNQMELPLDNVIHLPDRNSDRKSA